MDLVPEAHLERIKQDFITRLNKDRHLRTGFVGTPYLCRVLSKIGANDLAYKLLLREEYPSWLYAINLGATTIWERWNSLNPDGSISSTSMNSFNHYAYGSIVEWMYRDMCGLNPSSDDDGLVGFRHALIAPKPHASLRWARARYQSAVGVYKSGWRIDDAGHLIIEIEILPDTHLGEITINDHPLREGEQVGDHVELTLPSGCHRISYLFQKQGIHAS
jgi:alpha-L-rhamnosidase